MRNTFETFPEITIEEFDAITEDHEFSNAYKARKAGLIRQYKAKRSSHKHLIGLPPAAAAAVIFGLCTVTAFAGVGIYRFVVNQKSAYSVEAGLSTEHLADLKKVDEVTLAIGYIPEDMEKTDKGNYYFMAEDGQRGYYIDTIVVDTEGSWTENYVEEANTVSVGGREGLLLLTDTSGEAENDWKQYNLFVSYPEYDRLVKIWGWGHAEKEELLKIGESIEMQPTGRKVAVSDQAVWSQYLAYKGTNLTVEANEALNLNASDQDMKNLHQIGESFILSEGTDIDGNAFKVEAKVTGVQISEDLSLLQPEYIQDSWKSLLDTKGKIGCAELQFKKQGDGVDSMNKVVYTESVPMKLVYVTMELSNTGASDLKEYGFNGSLMRIEHDGSQWRIPALGENVKVPEEYDDVKYNTPLLGFEEMHYWEIEGNHATEKNYITDFAAGDSREILMAWIVPADLTNNLYLNMGDSWRGFIASDLELGYVELGLNN